MADGGQDFNLGHVVGSAGEKGDDGSTVWNTSTAPTYANSKYTFTISNLSGKTGLQIAVNDIIFYSTYYYIVSAVNTTTVDCSTRVSIKGSDASVTIQTSWGSTTSDSKVPSEKLTKDTLDTKIAKSSTTGLVKNDGTIMTSGTGSTNYSAGNHTHSGYISTSSTSGLVKNDGSIMTGGTGSSNWAIGNHTHSGYLSASKVTSWSSTVSDSNVPSEKLVKNTIDGLSIPTKTSDLTNDSNYISTSSTSGLIKNDGTIDTTSYSTFSGSYNDLSNKPTIPSASTTTPSADTSSGSYGSGTSYARSNHTHPKSSLYAEATHSHTKSQITDFPSIPSKTSDLTNDGADGTNVFVANNDSRLSDARTPTSHAHGNLTNDGKVGSTANYFVYTTTSGAITSKQKIGNITTSGAIGSTSGLPIKTGTSGVLEAGSFGTTAGTFAEGNHTHSAYVNPTKVTSWSSTPSDSNVASEKLIKDSLDDKQATLVSGTNLKTINNESLLGSGNITIQGGGGSGGSYINDFYGDSSTNELVIDYDTGVSQADIVTSWSSTTSDTNVPSEKLAKDTLDNKIDKSSTTGLVKNDGSIMTSGTGSTNYAAGNHTHSSYVSATKVTSWSSTVSDSNVPSEKLVKNYIDDQIGTAIQYIQQ